MEQAVVPFNTEKPLTKQVGTRSVRGGAVTLYKMYKGEAVPVVRRREFTPFTIENGPSAEPNTRTLIGDLFKAGINDNKQGKWDYSAMKHFFSSKVVATHKLVKRTSKQEDPLRKNPARAEFFRNSQNQLQPKICRSTARVPHKKPFKTFPKTMDFYRKVDPLPATLKFSSLESKYAIRFLSSNNTKRGLPTEGLLGKIRTYLDSQTKNYRDSKLPARHQLNVNFREIKYYA